MNTKDVENIVNKITEYKNSVVKAEAEERQAKADKIAQLEKQILDHGDAIKNILMVANHMISNGFYDPSGIGSTYVELIINNTYLLTAGFGVYKLTKHSKLVDLFGTTSIQSDGNTVYYTALTTSDDIDRKISDLEFFVENFKEVEQTFYDRINNSTKID